MRTSLTALNTSYAKEGAYINIPKNTIAEKPVEIIHFSSGKEESLWLQPRNLIVLDRNCSSSNYRTSPKSKNTSSSYNSVSLKFIYIDDAFLDYYKLQNDLTSASLIDNTFIQQEKNSHASVHTFSLGGKLIRNNLKFFHKWRRNITFNIEMELTILEGKQHVDHSTLVHHSKPNCESHQDYKGIFSRNVQREFLMVKF